PSAPASARASPPHRQPKTRPLKPLEDPAKDTLTSPVPPTHTSAAVPPNADSPDLERLRTATTGASLAPRTAIFAGTSGLASRPGMDSTGSREGGRPSSRTI